MADTRDVEIRLTFTDDGSGHLEKVVGQVVDTMAKAEQQTKKNKEGFEKLRGETEKSSGAFDKLKNSFMRSALQMAAGLGIWTSMSSVIGFATRNLRDIITQGKEFEEAWDKVEFAVNLSEKEMSAMQETILKMNPALGSTSQMAKAMGIAVRSFTEAKPAEWLKLVEIAARAAVATGGDMVQIMEGMGRIVKGYGLNIKDAANVTDVLVKASQRADVSMGELTMTLQRLSGPAKIAGVSFPELTAAYVKLAQTTGPQKATMQLNVLLMSLAKTSAAARVEAAKYGVDWSAAGVKVNGFVPTLVKLGQGIKGNEEALVKIIPGGRQMAGTLALIENGAKGLQKETDILTKEFVRGGAAAEAYYKQFGQLSQIIDMSKEVFNKFKIALFKGFSDAIKRSLNDPKDLEAAVQKATNSIVDSGRRIGEGIFNAAKWVKEHMATIKLAFATLATMLVVTKINAWSEAFLVALAKIIPQLGKFAGGVTAAIASMGPWSLLIAPVAIYSGKLIQLKAAIDKTTEASIAYDKANINLSNKLYQMVTSGRMNINTFYELTDKYNGNTAAMTMAIAKGKEGAAAQKAYIETFRQVPGTVLAANSALAAKVVIDNQEKKDLDLLREKMKAFGFTMKKDVSGSYDTLREGLVKLRGEMTQQKYDELTKQLRELGASTGHYQQTLIDLGIYMKGEEAEQLGNTRRRFKDLQDDLADGAYISWPQYYEGMQKVIQEFQKLDPEMRAIKDLGVKSSMEMKLEQQNLKQEVIDLGKAFKDGKVSAHGYAEGMLEARQKALDLVEGSKSLKDLGVKTFAQVQLDADKLALKLDDLNKSFTAGGLSAQEYARGLLAVYKAALAADPAIESLKKLKVLGVDDAAVQIEELNIAMRDLTIAFSLGKVPLSEYVAGMQEWKDQLYELNPAIRQMRRDAALLGVTFPEMADRQLPKLQEAFERLKMAKPPIETLAKAADTLIEQYKLAGKEVPKELTKISDQAKKTAAITGNDMVKAFSTIGTSLQVLGDSVGEKFKPLVTAASSVAGEISKSLEDQLSKIGEGGKLNFDNIKKAFKGLSAEMAGQLGGALASALGGSGKYAGIGSALGGALGSIIPGVGTAIGSFVGGIIGGLFGKKKKTPEQILKEEVDAIKKQYKSLGDISDETGKKIDDLTKKFNTQTAAIMALSDMMKDTGVTSKNLQSYVQKMTQALSDMKNKTVSVQNGLEGINSAFTEMIGQIIAQGQEGTKSIINFISYIRKLGIHVQEVDNYVNTWLGKGAAGIKSMTDALSTANYVQLGALDEQIKTLTDDITKASQSSLANRSDQLKLEQEKEQLTDLQKQYDQLKTTVGQEMAPELERVGTLTVATFNAMIAQGATVSEAFAALKDPIDALAEKYATLGIAGNAAIQQLLKMSEVEKANAGLMEAVGGNQQVLEALGNTGFMTADALQASADEAESFYKKLTDAGMTSQQALATMAPTLEDLAWYAKQYNLKLDDGTQSLIDQAKAAGVWKDKGKDFITTLQEGFDGIIKRLDRIVDDFDRMGKAAQRAGKDTREATGTGTGEEGSNVTYAQHGFTGTVTGPHLFYVEPGVKEQVNIGRPAGSGASGSMGNVINNIEKQITMEPIVLPWKDMESWVIRVVEKAASDERLILRPRSVRGRG